MVVGTILRLGLQGELSQNPASVVRLSRGAQLELHNIPNDPAPVVALRRGSQIEWKQSLMTERRKSDGKLINVPIRDVVLRRTVFNPLRGTKVYFSCNWAAGREGGLIYLHPDQTLDYLRISW